MLFVMGVGFLLDSPLIVSPHHRQHHSDRPRSTSDISQDNTVHHSATVNNSEKVHRTKQAINLKG